MFDIGWQELFVVALLAIIIVGPKDLPRAIRTVTGWLRRARSMAREFQNGLDDVVREAELDDIKKNMEKTSEFDIAKAIEDNVDPDGEIAKDLDLDIDPMTEDERAESYEPDDGLDDDGDDGSIDDEDGDGNDEPGEPHASGDETPEAVTETGKVT